MKTFIILLMAAISPTVYADSNCKILREDDVPAISWNEPCLNGLADGVGELVYRPEKPIKTFGLVRKGIITGLHITTENRLDHYVVYFRDRGSIVKFVGPAYFINKIDPNLVPQNTQWADANKPLDPNSKGQAGAAYQAISYEKVLSDIKAYIAQGNEPSVSFEVFKAYLEGRVSAANATYGINNNSVVAQSTGDVNKEADDPPVVGISLSLGNTKPKKKSKKKY